jgi:ABC-type antimicrobial peptide transport system permease subunit
MSETYFSINDLLRRKLQTSLALLSLTLSVASTLFLLLFAQSIGVDISTIAEGKLTVGFYAMFSPFITMLTVLILAAGAVLVSFTAFIMMAQRAKDIGLMKAAGCPNGMLFGYFFSELMIITFVACLLGTIFGVVLDVASTGFLTSLGLQISQRSFDLWTPFVVFIVFFVLSLVLGGAPIFSATRTDAAKAFSPTYYLGLAKESGFKPVSKSNLTMKLAVRALVRHRSAAVRMVLCLSTVFVLITVAVAGGLMAKDTTRSWIEGAVGQDSVLIAHRDMVDQYRQLLSKFYEGGNNNQFNYKDDRYLIPADLVGDLRHLNSNVSIDERLVLEAPVKEIEGVIYGDSLSQETRSVGDSREGESLVVGVDPSSLVSNWSLNGIFLEKNEGSEAVVGDSLAYELFSMPLNQSVAIFGENFKVVGVCFDPLNNGNVTYVPLRTLLGTAGMSEPNIILIRLDQFSSRAEALSEIQAAVQATNASDFEVFELDEVVDKTLSFLGSIWSTIMFVPLFSLITASLSLIGYVMLSLNDQRQEFGILRALGAKPQTILALVFTQSLIVLSASYAIGIALGVVTTLLILVENPTVAPYTIVVVSGWLFLAFVVTFASSIYPAIRFARKPLLETMTQF